MVQPSVNTAATSSSDRSASSAGPRSTPRWPAACAAARAGPPRRSPARPGRRQPVQQRGGVSSRVRAAASSIASGRPSSRRQISATAAALSSVRVKPGGPRGPGPRTAPRRARPPAPRPTRAGIGGSGNGGTGYSHSARSPSTVRLVAKIATPGQRASSSPRSRATWTTCSRLSRMSSQAPSPNVSARASSGEPARPGRLPPSGRGGQHQPRVGDRVQRHEHGARTEPITQPLAYRHRQPGLADPARPGQRHQPHPRTSISPATSSMARSRPSSDVVLTGSGPGPGHPPATARGPASASGGEPLAQQHRQVVAHQPPSSAGVRK